MRLRLVLVPVLALLIWLAAPRTTYAQLAPGGIILTDDFFYIRSGLHILAVPAYQRELAMTPSQRATADVSVNLFLNDLYETLGTHSSPVFDCKFVSDPNSVIKDPLSNFEPLSLDSAQIADRVFSAQDDAAAKILSPSQMVRYRQLEFQQEGPWLLWLPSVANALGLSDAQRDSVDALYAKQRYDLMWSPGPTGRHRVGVGYVSQETFYTPVYSSESDPYHYAFCWSSIDFATLDAYRSKFLAILTPEQLKQWNTMLGRPFSTPDPDQILSSETLQLFAASYRFPPDNERAIKTLIGTYPSDDPGALALYVQLLSSKNNGFAKQSLSGLSTDNRALKLH